VVSIDADGMGFPPQSQKATSMRRESYRAPPSCASSRNLEKFRPRCFSARIVGTLSDVATLG
jgi:hypothetical protein